MLRYLTGGESHGSCMLTILDGMPAGLVISKSEIDRDLSRRMFGYGRSKRMRMESDKVQILSGLRRSKTIGSPIAMLVPNAECSIDKLAPVLAARPGHADLAGALKYGTKDIRDILERSSARETAARVCVGAACKILLSEFGIRVIGHVTAIGSVAANNAGLEFGQIAALSERSPVRCADSNASRLMCREIDGVMKAGDTLGGIFEVRIKNVPPGLGSHAQWDRKIDANLARAFMSIQAIKGVGFGISFDAGRRSGREFHDEIFYAKSGGFSRKTNNAGGIEGGMTNGEEIVIRAAMKPISTLRHPLSSVNIKSKRAVSAAVERSDVCAVPAAAVIGEAVAAIEIANAMLEKFGGDSIVEMRRNYQGYLKQVRVF